MAPTGTQSNNGSPNGPRPWDRPWARAGAIAAGTAVLAAVAVGGGLWWAADSADEPEGGDAYTAAPDCGTVPDEAVSDIVPDAVTESDEENGPLTEGANTVCAWTSAGQTDDGTQAVLRVTLSVRFTDTSGDTPVTGAEHTEQAYADLLPPRGEAVALPSAVEGHVWDGQSPGTAELAFHTDNLLVRVSYAADSEGDPTDFADARERAVDAAEQVGEAL